MSAQQPIDMITLAIKRWKTVAIFAILATGGSVAYALTAEEWYAARLTVVPSQRSQDASALSLASKLPTSLGVVPTDVQRIQAVLRSVSVADAVIDKFDLDKRWGSAHRELTRQGLAQRCTTALDRKAGVVALTCEDTDPKTAMDVATYFGEVGNRVFARISASSAREERVFLEAQVEKTRAEVDETSRTLREFQDKHKIVDLPEQSKAVISAMASLQGDLLSKQLELTYLSSFSSSTESNVIQLQKQMAIMKSKLAQLESSRQVPVATGSASKDAGSAQFFPNAMDVPGLRYELEQLIREQKIQEAVYALTTQRYQMARIDEARETSTFAVLDQPTLPTLRSRPLRRKLVTFGLLGGLVLGLLVVVVPEWWRRRTRASA